MDEGERRKEEDTHRGTRTWNRRKIEKEARFNRFTNTGCVIGHSGRCRRREIKARSRRKESKMPKSKKVEVIASRVR